MAHQDDLDAILEQEFEGVDQRRNEQSPSKRQQISYFTVVCLILNRTIGSGIFVTPRTILLGTGSAGISIILWTLGAVVSTCGLLVWLEFGLSVPIRVVPGGHERPVPRSGGEKNYLEYLFQRPKFLVTCMYGVAFLILGNLAGNSVAFGEYFMRALGYVDQDVPRSWNIGIALAGLTLVCLVHVFSRRGGILISNIFAMLKVLILLAIIVIGFAVASGARFGPGTSQTANLNLKNAFATPQKDVSSYTYSFFYVLYSYSGFEQPFYVLSEVRRPRRVFPVATLSAIGITSVLFVLVNIAYVCATPVTPEYLSESTDMATLFFATIFGPGIAPRVMAALIATSIFGNIVVMTFTAARVKQEIAKEGILPFAFFFATGHATPDAWLQNYLSKGQASSAKPQSSTTAVGEDIVLEQTPMAALLLHWAMSLLLIGITAFLTATTAYFVLIFLYSYVLVALVGFCVSAGLIYLYFSPSIAWHAPGSFGFRPWGGPTAAIIYAVVSIFMLVTAFLKPADGSPFAASATKIQWYILPSIGLSALLWGVAWWVGFKLLMWSRKLELVVTRVVHMELDVEEDSGEGGADGGDWVQRSETIVHQSKSRAYLRATSSGGEPRNTDVVVAGVGSGIEMR